MDFLVLFWFVCTLVLVFLVVLLYKKAVFLHNELRDLQFNKDSQSVKYGKLTEQWIAFSDRFPYDPQRFRFVGNPIDGLVFEDEKIVFCEFKTASSQLNENQKRVKRLVENKKVEWLEFKIK